MAIKTLFTINKIDQVTGEIRTVHQGYSESFTKWLIAGLYVQHGSIVVGLPLANVKDIMGDNARNMDADPIPAGGAGTYWPRANLRLNAPSGGGGSYLPNGSAFVGGNVLTPGTAVSAFRPGSAFGIQIGTVNTAPTPIDFALLGRIGHGKGASVAAALVDAINTGDNVDVNNASTGANCGFCYSPRRGTNISSMNLKCFRTGNPGNVTLKILAVSAGNQNLNFDASLIATSNVVNANLWGAATPGAMETFTFASPVYLTPGCLYYFAIDPSQASGGNFVNYRATNNKNGRTNTKNSGAGTIGVGGGLSGNTYLALFELYGTNPAEMEFGGMEFYGYTVANPNASFNMSRLFRNNSGEAITVREAGIYTPGDYSLQDNTYNNGLYFLCAARDVFADIVVNSGQNLQVVYTPTITV